MNINVNLYLPQVRQLDRFVIYRDLNERFLLVDEATRDAFSFAGLQETIVVTAQRFNQMTDQNNRRFCQSKRSFKDATGRLPKAKPRPVTPSKMIINL